MVGGVVLWSSGRGRPIRRFWLITLASAVALAAAPATASALCNGLAPTITGSGAGETIPGTPGPDVIEAGDGDDTVNGGGGADTICGEGGSDTINGEGDNDWLDGGSTGTNVDTVTFLGTTAQLTADLAAGTATTTAGESDAISNFENLTGTNTFDLLRGDSGPNVLTGLNAADGFLGRGGDDTLVDPAFPADQGAAQYPDATGPVVGSIGNGTHTVTGPGVGTDTLENVRGIEGSPFGDQLTGDASIDGILGQGGNDVIEPRGGGDIVSGDAGADRVVFAGEGSVTVDLSLPSNNATTPTGTDSLYDVEDVTGSPESDSIAGDVNSNVIDGLGGDDTLDGAGGNDTASFAGLAQGVTVDLVADTATGQGSDTIPNFENARGSEANDQLTGDTNPNLLTGLAGADHLTGDAGADILNLGPGADQVTADDGEVDQIECEGQGPDSGTVDGPAPAEVFLQCDNDGDSLVDFLDACASQAGTGADGCPTQAAPAALPAPGAKVKRCKKGFKKVTVKGKVKCKRKKKRKRK